MEERPDPVETVALCTPRSSQGDGPPPYLFLHRAFEQRLKVAVYPVALTLAQRVDLLDHEICLGGADRLKQAEDHLQPRRPMVMVVEVGQAGANSGKAIQFLGRELAQGTSAQQGDEPVELDLGGGISTGDRLLDQRACLITNSRVEILQREGELLLRTCIGWQPVEVDVTVDDARLHVDVRISLGHIGRRRGHHDIPRTTAMTAAIRAASSDTSATKPRNRFSATIRPLFFAGASAETQSVAFSSSDSAAA